MDVARDELAQDDSRSPFVVVAREQSSGRGRHGRRWESPAGGLYLTAAYPWERDVSALVGLSLVVGLALRDSLGDAAARLELKWPNDLVTREGRKLAGILIEVNSAANGTSVLIGIGLNLHRVLVDDSGRSDANLSSLAPIGLSELTSQKVDPEHILSQLLSNLNQVLEHFKRSGFAAFRQIWSSVSALNGCQLQIDTGTKILHGAYAGVNDSGALLLETDVGVCEIASGHILLINRASQ